MPDGLNHGDPFHVQWPNVFLNPPRFRGITTIRRIDSTFVEERFGKNRDSRLEFDAIYEFIVWPREERIHFTGSARKQHRFGWQTIENPISKVQAKGFEEETGNSIDPLFSAEREHGRGEKMGVEVRMRWILIFQICFQNFNSSIDQSFILKSINLCHFKLSKLVITPMTLSLHRSILAPLIDWT